MLNRKEDDRMAKVRSLIGAAERLEAAGDEEGADAVTADLEKLAIFGWRGMPATLRERSEDRHESEWWQKHGAPRMGEIKAYIGSAERSTDRDNIMIWECKYLLTQCAKLVSGDKGVRARQELAEMAEKIRVTKGKSNVSK